VVLHSGNNVEMEAAAIYSWTPLPCPCVAGPRLL